MAGTLGHPGVRSASTIPVRCFPSQSTQSRRSRLTLLGTWTGRAEPGCPWRDSDREGCSAGPSLREEKKPWFKDCVVAELVAPHDRPVPAIALWRLMPCQEIV